MELAQGSPETYSIFSFSNLEHPELLSARAQHHQTFHFVMNLISICSWFPFLPVGSKGSNELLPINETFTVSIKQICNGSHLHSWCVEFYSKEKSFVKRPRKCPTRLGKLTRIDDSIDEDIARYQAIVVLVHLAEQIRQTWFLVVHELQELRTRRKIFMKMMMKIVLDKMGKTLFIFKWPFRV